MDDGVVTPGFDQVAAYRTAEKIGLAQTIAAVRAQLDELAHYSAGRTLSFPPFRLPNLIAVTEEKARRRAQLEHLEAVARGEILSNTRVQQLTQVRGRSTPRRRPSALAT